MQILKIFALFILLLVLFSIRAFSLEDNSASLSGYANDTLSGETLIGATVLLKGTKQGAFSNKSGFFSIKNIKPGKYTVVVSFLGYEKIEKEFVFKPKESRRETFKLKPSSISTSEVSVIAEREIEKREITISKIHVPVAQLKEIRIGGEADVFRSLQMMPGILTSSQISSGLFVRGGSPDQNLVLIDGTTVYNPSHLFGFISTFNTDAVKDVELIKGGFPAEYGGRLSAVLNITQKDGNQEKYQGNVNIGMLASRASVEGPLGNGAFFIGARRTYLELIKSFISEDPESPLPDFNFYDVNAKISQNFGKNDKVFLSSFISADNMEFDSYGMNMNLEIANKMVSARWNHIFDDDLFSVVNISASNYKNYFKGDQSGYAFLMENNITDYTAKASIEWFTTDKLTQKYGFEVSGYEFSYLQDFTGDLNSQKADSSAGVLNLTINDIAACGFGQWNYQVFDLLSIQAGLRINYWELSKKTTYDPRIAIKYQYTEDIAFKASWGIFHQNLRLATQQDFSFFDTWLPTDESVSPSQGIHYIFSVETALFKNFDFNLDFYYKNLQNINELNITNYTSQGNKTKVSDIFYSGDGYSYGAEVFLLKKMGKITGWIGYAVGFIRAEFDSINGGAEFRPKYDRTHDLKIVAQWEINKKWSVGGSFTFQSGQSYTGQTSRFQSRLLIQNYGRGKTIPSQMYGLRLPPSHQLNLNATYSFKIAKFPAKLLIDIYNVYNHRDIWFRYYNNQSEDTYVEDVLLLPIIPTVSFEMSF